MPEKTAQKEPGKKPAPSKKPKPQQEVVVRISLSELHPFPDHPFQVREDAAMQETAESVKEYEMCIRDRIPDWPDAIKARARLGDFEGDTVYGGVGKGLLVTLVDRRDVYKRQVCIFHCQNCEIPYPTGIPLIGHLPCNRC